MLTPLVMSAIPATYQVFIPRKSEASFSHRDTRTPGQGGIPGYRDTGIPGIPDPVHSRWGFQCLKGRKGERKKGERGEKGRLCGTIRSFTVTDKMMKSV